MKITPLDIQGAILIDAYGGSGFRIGGQRHEGSVIITLGNVLAWPAKHADEITVEALAAVFGDEGAKPDILLVGCGPNFMMLPQALRDWAKDQGIMLDSMDTGAAARTYNILKQEDRSVVAALIAVE